MEPSVADFWSATRAILNETPPDAALDDCPERSGREYRTWSVTLHSYGGQRLRGFYTAPRDRPPSGRLPAMLAVPGYGGAKEIPYYVAMQGFAVLTLFPRAQGESLAEWNLPAGATKLTYNITDRETYYYRAAYMDCVRGVDFLAARPEVDAARIGMWSRSQGGGFTLATAALDHRIAAAVAEEPFLCNYPGRHRHRHPPLPRVAELRPGTPGTTGGNAGHPALLRHSDLGRRHPLPHAGEHRNGGRHLSLRHHYAGV